MYIKCISNVDQSAESPSNILHISSCFWPLWSVLVFQLAAFTFLVHSAKCAVKFGTYLAYIWWRSEVFCQELVETKIEVKIGDDLSFGDQNDGWKTYYCLVASGCVKGIYSSH